VESKNNLGSFKVMILWTIINPDVGKPIRIGQAASMGAFYSLLVPKGRDMHFQTLEL